MRLGTVRANGRGNRNKGEGLSIRERARQSWHWVRVCNAAERTQVHPCRRQQLHLDDGARSRPWDGARRGGPPRIQPRSWRRAGVTSHGSVRRSRPRRRTRGAVLPGYLCEVCLDAPATRLVPAPKGGEMGICEACGIPEDAEEERP